MGSKLRHYRAIPGLLEYQDAHQFLANLGCQVDQADLLDPVNHCRLVCHHYQVVRMVRELQMVLVALDLPGLFLLPVLAVPAALVHLAYLALLLNQVVLRGLVVPCFPVRLVLPVVRLALAVRLLHSVRLVLVDRLGI